MATSIEITTDGVYKPGAGTYLYGYGHFWIDSYRQDEVTIKGYGYAYSDRSIQNGVACCGGGSGWDTGIKIGYGVTNRGNPVAHWSYEDTWNRLSSDRTVDMWVEVYGTKVDGYSAYNNGSTSGSYDSPLAIKYGQLVIPAIATSAVPAPPVVQISGNVVKPRVAVTANATWYRLEEKLNNGAWTDKGETYPDYTYSYTLPDCTYVQYRVKTRGADGVTKVSDPSPVLYTTPNPPAGLTIQQPSASSPTLKLTWSNMAPAYDKVEISRSTNANMSGATVVFTGKAATFTDTTTSASVPTYYYRARTYAPHGAVTSLYWTGYTPTVSKSVVTAPNKPTDFVRVGDVNSASYSFTWGHSSTETNNPQEFILMSKEGTGAWVELSRHAPTARSATIALPVGSVRSFKIIAVNVAGQAESAATPVLYNKPFCAQVVSMESDTTLPWVKKFTFQETSGYKNLGEVHTLSFAYAGSASPIKVVDIPAAGWTGTYALNAAEPGFIPNKNIQVTHTVRFTSLPDSTAMRESSWAAPYYLPTGYGGAFIPSITQTSTINLQHNPAIQTGQGLTYKVYRNAKLVATHANVPFETTQTFPMPPGAAALSEIFVGVFHPWFSFAVASPTVSVDLDQSPVYIGKQRFLAYKITPTNPNPVPLSITRIEGN